MNPACDICKKKNCYHFGLIMAKPHSECFRICILKEKDYDSHVGDWTKGTHCPKGRKHYISDDEFCEQMCAENSHDKICPKT